MAKRLTLAGLVVLVLAAGWILWTAGRGARVGESATSGAPEAAAPVEEPVAVVLAPVDAPDVPEPARTIIEEEDGASAVPVAKEDRALDEAEACLRIRVVSQETGEPLASIRLMLSPSPRGFARHVDRSRGRPDEALRTDDEGRAEFLVAAGQAYELHANIGGSQGAENKRVEVPALVAREERELLVELRTRADLVWFGRAVDGETGAPLAQATFARVEGEPFETTVTGEPVHADGSLEVRVASWSRDIVRIDCPGYSPGLVAASSGHEDPARAQVVSLWRSAALDVRVEDARGDAGTFSARVMARHWDMLTREEGIWFGFEDPSWEGNALAPGQFEFSALPPRVPVTLEIRGTRDLLRRESLTLDPGERRELELSVGAGCTIAGRAIRPSGEPVSDLEVWLAAPGRFTRYFQSFQRKDTLATTRTDEGGEFSFDDVEPGIWLVGPAPGEGQGSIFGPGRSYGAIAPVAVEVTIRPGDVAAAVTLTCWTGLFIRGIVLDSADVPVRDAHVSAAAEGIWCDTSSGGDGRFELGPLVPGDYHLGARLFQGLLAPSETVLAQAGAEGIELRMRAGGTVSATVLDDRGRAIRGASARLVPASTGLEGWMGSSTGEDGQVRFGGVIPGRYALFAAHGGNVGVLGGLSVEAGEPIGGLELVLEPGVKLVVHVPPGLSGPRAVQVTRAGQMLHYEGLGPAGECTFQVPAGEITVELLRWDDGGEIDATLSKTVEARLGEETRVEFEDPQGPR